MYTEEKEWDPITLDMYVDSRAAFSGFDKNDCPLKVKCDCSVAGIDISIEGERRAYILQLNNCNYPVSVTQGNEVLQEVPAGDVGSTGGSWNYDHTTGIVLISLFPCGNEHIEIKK